MYASLRQKNGKYTGVHSLPFLAKIPTGKVCCFEHVWEKFGGKNRIFVLNFGIFVLNFGISVHNFGIFALNYVGTILVFLPEYLPLLKTVQHFQSH